MSSAKYKLIDRAVSEEVLVAINQANGLKPERPCITIARDPGSGGKPIAQLLAKELKYRFYNKALIEDIAKSAKRRKQVIDKIDEKTRSAIQDLVHNLFNPEYISDFTYINHLTSVVLSVSSQGKAVILGRGANFIVPSEHALRVLITAPRKVCHARAIKHEKLSAKKAMATIDKFYKERRDFVSQYFHKRYSNPKYYDVIINTHYYSLKGSKEIIKAAYRNKFGIKV